MAKCAVAEAEEEEQQQQQQEEAARAAGDEIGAESGEGAAEKAEEANMVAARHERRPGRPGLSISITKS